MSTNPKAPWRPSRSRRQPAFRCRPVAARRGNVPVLAPLNAFHPGFLRKPRLFCLPWRSHVATRDGTAYAFNRGFDRLVLGTRRKLAFDNLALRQQIIVLQRSVKRPRLRKSDRVFWALLSKTWSDWANTLTLVKPDTVVRWHRKGHGRLAVPSEVRHRDLPGGGLQVHGRSSQTTVAIVASVSQQPCERPRLHGLPGKVLTWSA